MKINGINGTNVQNAQTGAVGMPQGNDSVSKNIQNQIARAQQKLQDLSSNEEMSLDDKMKKRQEIQQEITNLNQQLRQHQIEQRKEQQNRKSSMDNMLGGTPEKTSGKGKGLSQANMQTMILADSSMKQAGVHSSVASKMEGRANVLEAEIKQDAGTGSAEKKKAELADLQEKTQAATEAQMSSLADVRKSIEEATKADDNTGNNTEAEKMGTAENTQQSPDSTANTDVKAGGHENLHSTATEGAAVEGSQAAAQQTAYTPIDVRL